MTEQLSEYELMRLERIRKNEAYLESLGLKQHKDKLIAQTQKTKRNQNRAKKYHIKKVKPGEERRSLRHKKTSNKSKDLVMLSYSDPDDTATPTAVKQTAYFAGNEVTPSPRNLTKSYSMERPADKPSSSFRGINRTPNNSELTEEERAILSQDTMDSNYLEKFEEFLVYHNKISDQNRRNVMKQVTKLARGEGVRYESPTYGWKPDQYFQRGIPVTPLSDFVELMDLARECENKWGRDHGNGWLLSHPLKKMLLFQQFCLQNPDFLSSKCQLKDYYAQDDEEEEEEDDDDDVEVVEQMEEEQRAEEEEVEERKYTAATVSESSSEDEESDDGSKNKRGREEYTGKRVAKKFGRKVYQGTVQKYDESSKFWSVVYDDGDEEEMDDHEVQAAIELFESPPKRGRPRKKARTD